MIDEKRKGTRERERKKTTRGKGIKARGMRGGGKEQKLMGERERVPKCLQPERKE